MSHVTTGDFGVGSWVERRARITPDHPALVFGARSLGYAELAERVRRLANGLRRLGVGRGDRVAWLGPNHPAFLESLFAAGQLGAVLAPVNHRLGPEEQTLVLALTEPVVLIQHAAVEPVVAAPVRHRITVGGLLEGMQDYEALVARSSDEPVAEPVGLGDLLLLPHTSGTTGSPKAVMLTHGNVTWNAVNFLTSADFRREDVTIAIAPFFRVGGTGVNVLPVLFAGGTVVVPDDPRPDALLGLMERHRVTVGFGNPDLLDAIAHASRWPSADLSSVRFVVTGGAPVPERLIRAYLERAVTLVQGYGLSEAAPLVLLLAAERALEKVGSAGRPPLFVEIRIIDDAGGDVSPGETGELLVRGPNIMAGYWRQPAETREVILEGGWLRTGDAARIDDDGDVWIVDRLAARFESAGGVVYPGDVERVLQAHPAVAEAGVVGVAGPRDGRVGAAFVVLSPEAAATEDELLAFCRSRLTAHQVPTSISFVGALPRNAVGKLLRDDLSTLASRESPTALTRSEVPSPWGHGRLHADDPSLRVGVPVDQLLGYPRDEGGHMTGSPILAPWRDRVDDVAPVVLVIGGFMSSPPMYRGLRRLLLERGAPEVVIARLWTPDWMLAVGRGQGAIAARAGSALLDASAASAASEASAGAPVLVVGHSGGGVIARILTSREPFERRRMNASGRIGAIVTLGSPQMFDAKGPSAQRMGATALWANRHVPGAFAAPRTGYLCVGSDAIVGSSSGDRKARRIDRYYRGVISAPEGASIPGDGITPLAAAFLPGVESIVLHDAGHANVIARHWYGDADHVDAWWPRAVEVWRDALRARVRAGDAAAASDTAAGESRDAVCQRAHQ